MFDETDNDLLNASGPVFIGVVSILRLADSWVTLILRVTFPDVILMVAERLEVLVLLVAVN